MGVEEKNKPALETTDAGDAQSKKAAKKQAKEAAKAAKVSMEYNFEYSGNLYFPMK